VWAKREVIPFLDEEPRILRPANYPSQVPGRGVGTFELENGEKVTVVNLEGRVFMKTLECPFRTGERILEEVSYKTPVMIIDFHAEATSEKVALGRFWMER
jgi:calcineurin-like phosphoesterase